ncbi:MAG: VWA domain-containing protein [Planctomycetes bacterium]|nr:VWA domain-containing protein [Planctomycetota bacterium]
MSLRLADPSTLLWLLVLVPVAVACLVAVGVARARRRRLLGEQADALLPGFSTGRRLLRDGLMLLACAAVLLALAGPQLGTEVREVQRRGVDVMVVLDVSRSMLAQDVKPSRLDRAKREIRGLLDRMLGDRMGLVTFAGDAKRILPLTHDANTYRLFLDDVDTTTNRLGGTAIGEGLERALDSFDEARPEQGVIVLLTDGEDHDSDPPPREVAFKARARGIPIHVVAVGTADGGTIPLPDSSSPSGTTLLLGPDGQPVVTRPDEDLLREIADVAQGEFLSTERTAFPLDELYTKRIAVMPGVARTSRQAEVGIDRSQWVLAFALGCLLLRAVLRDTPLPDLEEPSA